MIGWTKVRSRLQLSTISVDFFFAKISFQLYFRSAIMPIAFVSSSTFLITALVAPLPVGCCLIVRL